MAKNQSEQSENVTEVFQSYHGGQGLSITRRNGVISLVTKWELRKDRPTERLTSLPTDGIMFGGKRS